MTEQRKSWICSTIDRRPLTTDLSQRSPDVTGRALGTSALEGLALKSAIWKKGAELRVRFLEGTPKLHARVLAAARAWLVDGVRLSIEESRPGEKAQIRVAFKEGDGSWSAVGTEAQTYHPSQPTMNLGWATLDTPALDFDSVVIHEFGHALGLLHEHNHPKAKIRWNKPAVNADLSGDPNYWDQETIDLNVYEAYDKSEVITTSFDDASIMIYTIPSHWTLNGEAFMPSWKLSDGDTATIRRLYGS